MKKYKKRVEEKNMADYAKKTMNTVLAYAFTAGIVIALVLGLVSPLVEKINPMLPAILTSVLILAGIGVGFANITESETRDYILFVTALVVVLSLGGSTLGQIQTIGPYLESVLWSLMTFVLPSVVIVSVRAIFRLAKD
jgi:sugar phosphate permease